MKATLFSFFFLLTCCSFFYLSNDDNDELVEIAPDFFVEKSLVNSDKAKKIHEVFRNLKAAKGDYRSRKPELHLVSNTGKGIAVAYQLSGVIKLEEKGYDLCASFGGKSDDALAILLAHELIHIYEKHSWENLFAWEYSHTSLKNAVSNEQKKDEIQADYMGGVLAYQAGYKVFGIMPQFLDKVYDTYKLRDENMTDYPGIEQRKLFAVESEDKFRYFTNIFEIANLLTVKEVYDDALSYYDKVLQDFKSREVYNNIGVVAFQSALQHFSPIQNKFAYPVELDVVSRMSKGGKGDVDLDKRERMLMDAIHYFENARHLDPQYPIAHLNKACANALLGVAKTDGKKLEWMDATVSAERAINLTKGKKEWTGTLSDSYVALGILSALQGDDRKAKKHFKKALEIEPDNLLARANRSALADDVYPFAGSGDLQESKEVIDNTPFDKMDFGSSHVKYELRKSPTDSIALWRMDLPNSYVIAHESLKGNPSSPTQNFYIFHLTEEGYQGTTSKGISLDNGTYDTIIEKYGKPHKELRLGNGSMLQYEFKNQELIFQVAPTGKLVRWCIFQELG